MIAEISAAVQGVQALTEMLKTGSSVADASRIAAAVAEVNAKLLHAVSAAVEAKQREAAFIDRIRDLEREVGELKNWDREAQRYQLTEIEAGMPAYAPKPGMENGEPQHYLCANCFARKEKSFLEYGPIPGEMSCARCPSMLRPSGGRQIGVVRLQRS